MVEQARLAVERIFFYCSGLGPPEQSRYQHQAICLAEGFKELRVGFFSNSTTDSLTRRMCGRGPSGFRGASWTRRTPLFLSPSGSAASSGTTGHCTGCANGRIGTYFPACPVSWLAVNATVDPTQPAGLTADELLLWHQTGRHHLPDYYKRLRQALACSCFCGNFVAPYPRDQARRKTMADRIRGLLQRDGGYRRISQWDSWRLWEAFAAGVLVVTTDLENHGARLPVMPRNGKDYLGIDVADIPAAIDVLKNGAQSLATIAGSGRPWALTHYAPVPTASRFLETIFTLLRFERTYHAICALSRRTTVKSAG